jgi:TonB family protein
MSRTDLIQAKINAAIQEGKGKVLSRPKIVSKSGEEASFLVGGQIPVKTTTTSSGGNVEENIAFHDYGVNLKIKATAKEDGKIDIDLNVDVSDIDSANAVGDTVAYTTRSAQTKLFLDNGQTIILAGFMKDNKGQTVKRVPLLGSFPIFGFLFRNKNVTADSQTELFITLVPRVVVTNEPKKIASASVKEEQAREEKNQKIISLLAKTETDYKKPSYQPVLVPGYMASYARSVQERIASNVLYPKAAKETKAQGSVELTLSIIKSGALASASVSKSSGYAVLDEAALETVHKLSPYLAFPLDSSIKEMTLTIPIVYQLN